MLDDMRSMCSSVLRQRRPRRPYFGYSWTYIDVNRHRDDANRHFCQWSHLTPWSLGSCLRSGIHIWINRLYTLLSAMLDNHNVSRE